MTADELKAARALLGLTQAALADALRLGRGSGRAIRRWESGAPGVSIPGPVQVAVEMMVERHEAQRKAA